MAPEPDHLGDALADPPRILLSTHLPGPEPEAELLAVEPGELGGEAPAPLRHDVGPEIPVTARHEVLDLRLAGADKPKRHRLHAPGRMASADLTPQHGRGVKAHEVTDLADLESGVFC